MMFNLYVLQNQWIIIALLCGVALMLLFCLTYAAMWRPREAEKKSETVEVTGPTSFGKAFLSVVPWVLVLLALGSAAFTVVMLALRASLPPNW